MKSFLLHRILFRAERAKTHICPRFTTGIHQRGSICIPGHCCPAEICRGECVDADTKPSCEVWLSFQGQNTRRIFSFFKKPLIPTFKRGLTQHVSHKHGVKNKNKTSTSRQDGRDTNGTRMEPGQAGRLPTNLLPLAAPASGAGFQKHQRREPRLRACHKSLPDRIRQLINNRSKQ